MTMFALALVTKSTLRCGRESHASFMARAGRLSSNSTAKNDASTCAKRRGTVRGIGDQWLASATEEDAAVEVASFHLHHKHGCDTTDCRQENQARISERKFEH